MRTRIQELKRLIPSDRAPTQYYVNRPVRLETDASPYGIRAVISHVMGDGEERPVVFPSRTLSKSEKNDSQIEKEGLIVIWGLVQPVHGRPYLNHRDRPSTTVDHLSSQQISVIDSRCKIATLGIVPWWIQVHDHV